MLSPIFCTIASAYLLCLFMKVHTLRHRMTFLRFWTIECHTVCHMARTKLLTPTISSADSTACMVGYNCMGS